jgi:hypothetical protein
VWEMAPTPGRTRGAQAQGTATARLHLQFCQRAARRLRLLWLLLTFRGPGSLRAPPFCSGRWGAERGARAERRCCAAALFPAGLGLAHVAEFSKSLKEGSSHPPTLHLTRSQGLNRCASPSLNVAGEARLPAPTLASDLRGGEQPRPRFL